MAFLQMRSNVALLACVLCAVAAVNADGTDPNVQFIKARMGQFKVDHEDAYLCTAVPLPDEPLKLVGIEPLAKQEIAHHMLLFGEARCSVSVSKCKSLCRGMAASFTVLLVRCVTLVVTSGCVGMCRVRGASKPGPGVGVPHAQPLRLGARQHHIPRRAGHVRLGPRRAWHALA